MRFSIFFFNDTATTEIYTLSLHDALPICTAEHLFSVLGQLKGGAMKMGQALSVFEAALPEELAGPYRAALTKLQEAARSEEHTSELQSRQYLVCRLLLEKKK